MKRQFLTIRAFCDAYGVGRTTTYELINAGKLRRIKVGSRTLIPGEDAEAWKAGLLQVQADEAAT